MPLSYQFTKRSTGEKVSLDDIDKKVCSDFGRQYSETNYCLEFNLISVVGDAAWGSGKWDHEKFDRAMGSNDDSVKALFKKYLKGEYTYDCWYSSK